MDVLGDISGLPGLFTACLFSGALSTISSGLNSIAACVVEDVVRGYISKNITDIKATRLTQIIAVVFGLICLALTLVCEQLGNILQAALSLFGMIAGPLLGLFTLGLMFPWANKWGGITGLIGSLILMFWIGIGAFIEEPLVKPTPPIRLTTGCIYKNITMESNVTSFVTSAFNISTFNTVTEATGPVRSAIHGLYTLSYIWYGFYSVIAVIVIGLIVSFLTGYTRPETLDPKLICPIFDILPPFRFLPEVLRKPLRFGIVHKGKYDGMKTDEEILEELKEIAKKTLGDVLDMSLEVKEKKPVETGKALYTNGYVNEAVIPSCVDDIDGTNTKKVTRM